MSCCGVGGFVSWQAEEHQREGFAHSAEPHEQHVVQLRRHRAEGRVQLGKFRRLDRRRLGRRSRGAGLKPIDDLDEVVDARRRECVLEQLPLVLGAHGGEVSRLSLRLQQRSLKVQL